MRVARWPAAPGARERNERDRDRKEAKGNEKKNKKKPKISKKGEAAAPRRGGLWATGSSSFSRKKRKKINSKWNKLLFSSRWWWEGCRLPSLSTVKSFLPAAFHSLPGFTSFDVGSERWRSVSRFNRRMTDWIMETANRKLKNRAELGTARFPAD